MTTRALTLESLRSDAIAGAGWDQVAIAVGLDGAAPERVWGPGQGTGPSAFFGAGDARELGLGPWPFEERAVVRLEALDPWGEAEPRVAERTLPADGATGLVAFEPGAGRYGLDLAVDEALARVEVTARALRVRSAPGLGGRILGLVRRGDAHAVFEERGDWLRVLAEGRWGWCHRGYVQRITGAEADEADAAAPEREVEVTARPRPTRASRPTTPTSSGGAT